MKKTNPYHIFAGAVAGIILTILLLLAMKSTAHTVNDVPIKDIDVEYMQIVGTQKLLSTKVTIELDFGQTTNFWKTTDNQNVYHYLLRKKSTK